jgi:hypothetical protein
VLEGCVPSNTPKPKHKSPKGSFLHEFHTGYAGYAWEFKGNQGESVWQSSIDFLLNGNINPEIQNVNPETFEALRENLDDSKFIVMWFTKNWQDWYFDASLIQKAMDQGKIPIFLYWYFGDDFATEEFSTVFRDKLKSYFAMNKKILNFLNKLDGEVILLFEPEFNKQRIVENQRTIDTFTRLMGYSLDYFRNNISKNVTLYQGLSMNDNGIKYKDEAFDLCGYEHCALGDKYTWNKSINILKSLADKTDIVAFSIMLSQFSRGNKNPDKPHKYKNEKLGINHLSQRIANLSHELHTQVGKPVFLSHLVMASGTWSDANHNKNIEPNEINPNGWNEAIYKTYSKFDYNLFHQNGLFGLALMNLFDDPKHDIGGYNYFLQNEHHLGIISTGVDAESLQAKDGNLEFKTFNDTRLIDLIYKK